MEEQRIRGTAWVASEYRVAEDLLVQAGPYVANYNPMDRKELPSEIYKLKEGDIDGLLKFARRYGRLGQPLVTQFHVAYISPQDKLSWVWSQIRTVKLVMDALKIVQRNDEVDASRFLANLRSNGESKPGWWSFKIEVSAGYSVKDFGFAFRPDEPPLPLVAHIAATLIGWNISGVTRVPYQDGSRVRSQLAFSALYEPVYWMLLDAAEGGELRVCKECHAPFIATDERQDFCPKRFGEKESRCALRQRQRKWRAEHAKPNSNRGT